jgi:hypothetical protein
MPPRRHAHHLTAPLVRQMVLWGSLALAGCAATVVPASAAPPAQAAGKDADAVGAVTVSLQAGTPATSRASQLRAAGYVEQEFFLRAPARGHAPDGEWHKDGLWHTRPRTAPQTIATRLLVRRPADPARFNGMVVIEWLNTTVGYDLDGGWLLTRDELMREGYAWVGVSAEKEGIAFLKAADTQRYASLTLPANDLAFDTYTDAARAVRQHSARMLGLPKAPDTLKLIGMGYSQSAVFLYTYLDAFQPVERAFDGFFMHGAAPAAAPVDPDQSHVFAPRIRPDLNVPVMQLQTEMEVMVSWPLSSTPDTDHVRYWEVAGAAHLNQHMQRELGPIALPSLKPSRNLSCFRPRNTLPLHLVDQAALNGLRTWITQGLPPPVAPRLQRNSLGFVRNDEWGNAEGGIRLPQLTVPVAHYGMYSNFSTSSLSMRDMYACIAGGSTVPFDAATMARLYPSREAYVERFRHAAQQLAKDGFLRPADVDTMVEQAASDSRLPD